MLRRLVAYYEASGDRATQLLVATVDPDAEGSRAAAWLLLVDRVTRRHGTPAMPSRVVSWVTVQRMLSRGICQANSPGDPRQRDHSRREVESSRWGRAPGRTREKLLHLVGRHPFLTAGQLARLLDTTSARVRRVEDDLVTCGWLRRVLLQEVQSLDLRVTSAEFDRLGLVEITLAGRKRLAGWLGLDPTTASRYHGLIGDGRLQAGKRRRLLGALAHTVGANEVFVSFAVAANTIRQAGGNDELVEWRGASACERNYCKPDGYGCYVRNGQSFGFFLEFDRGTERGRHYAAKLRAYYRYRDSGQAARGYSSFPTVLFVTTKPIAEQRMASSCYRAAFIRGTEPLPILSTTVELISSNPQGIRGPIWRVETPSRSKATRHCWPPEDFRMTSVVQ
jgi:hypothetical protein